MSMSKRKFLSYNSIIIATLISSLMILYRIMSSYSEISLNFVDLFIESFSKFLAIQYHESVPNGRNIPEDFRLEVSQELFRSIGLLIIYIIPIIILAGVTILSLLLIPVINEEYRDNY